MYTIVWKKYLPVIRLLMKKSAGGDQVLGLNKTDFEKDKVARKTNARFSFHFANGILQKSGTISPAARELIDVLQVDSVTGDMMRQSNFAFNMTNRYELTIHSEPKERNINDIAAEAEAANPAVVAS